MTFDQILFIKKQVDEFEKVIWTPAFRDYVAAISTKRKRKWR